MTQKYVPGAVSNLLGNYQATSDESEKSKGGNHLIALFSPNQSAKKKKVKGLKNNYEKILNPDLGDKDLTNTNKKRKKPQLIDDLEEEYEKKKSKKQETTTNASLKGSESSAKGKKEFPRPRRDRKKRDPNQENRTIFVGNLSVDVDKKTVKKVFRKYGEVESLRFRSAAPADLTLPKKAIMITKNFHDQRHNLNCYLVFKEDSAAKEALKENGTELKGLHMRVDIALKAVQHKHSNSVFVGNLPFDAEEEPLREHFEDCGDIENVRLIRDRKTQLGKGFGYVTFSDKASVELALKIDGESWRGRKLRISRSSINPSGSTQKEKKPVTTGRQNDKRSKQKNIRKPRSDGKEMFQGVKATRDDNIKKKFKKSKQKPSDTIFPESKLGRKNDKKKHHRKIPSSKIGARNRISKKMKKGKKSSEN